MLTHKIRSTVSQLSLITFLAVLICASPLYASDCSVQSLTGFYGFVITGDRSGSPVTIAGEMAADGSGSLSGLETISQNGSILDSAEILGNYTINSNCTGKLAIQGQGLPQQNFDVSLSSGGKAISMVETDPGTTETGTAEAQGPTACSTTRLNGSYAIKASGAYTPNGPVALSGQINFHGNGTLDGIETTSSNGVITSGAIAGGYKITDHCFGAASISVGGHNFIFLDLYVVNGGQGIDFIQGNAQTMVAGSMQQ